MIDVDEVKRIDIKIDGIYVVEGTILIDINMVIL